MGVTGNRFALVLFEGSVNAILSSYDQCGAPGGKLIVSRATPLQASKFLGYRLSNRAKLAWAANAQHRFKERIRQITSRNRGHKV
jgi:hypothetical protein